MKKRLESLDALRGFDLFCLVVLEGFVHKLGDAIDAPWYQPVVEVFSHKSWEGFSPWDLVMPLFMFMAGVTIPFSMEKYRQHTAADAPSPAPQQRKALWGRLMKRFIVLWVLGMACQGNLLGLDPHRIYLFTNTLQAIAVGYLFSAILFLHLPTTDSKLSNEIQITTISKIESGNTYYISNYDGLKKFNTLVYSSGVTFEKCTIKLYDDIDVDGSYGFSVDSNAKCFKGTFDGQGHRINLICNISLSERYVGLFPVVENATIKNLGGEDSGGRRNGAGPDRSGEGFPGHCGLL